MIKVSRPKIPFDAIRIANSNLDMVLYFETCGRIQFGTFPENPSHGIEGLLLVFFSRPMNGVNDSTI
jgi:hypothetical protein